MTISKIGWAVAGAAVAVGIVMAAGADKAPAAKPAAPAMTQEQMMAAWQKSAAVGPEHAVLKNFEGKWTSHVTASMDPSQPPQVSDGTSEGMMLMDGRFVHVLHHGTMMGQPFEGMMLLGYDNIAKKYTSVWVDNMGTQIARYEGTYNPAKKALTMAGHFTDPMTGKPAHTRGVTAFPTPDTMTYDEYMAGPDGKEFKGLHIDFKKS